jgi:hypothetical protein
MSRARRLILAAVVILGGGALLPGLGAQAAWAQAPPHQICDPNLYCLNAWNGGPWIREYDAGTGNNYFYVEQLTGMCNNGYSTNSCPLNGSLNTPGELIYQIRYGNKYAGGYDNCLADDGAKDGQTAFGFCNTLSGGGGSDGTIYQAFPFPGCPSGSNEAISREWTDHYGAAYGIELVDASGQPVYDNTALRYATCLYQF